MLEAIHLSAGYPDKIVVDDFCASFEEGKLYILIGRNGSGKSTLLNTLGGWLKPLEGKVIANDVDLAALSAKERAGLTGRMASAPENTLPLERFVLMGSYAREKWLNPYSVKNRKIAMQAMKRMQIDHLARERMDQISSGQKQRAAIAQVLVQNPRCLLLDEPGSSLDPAARFELMEMLLNLKSDQRILLAVVHDLDLALRYGDEILVLDNGKLKFRGTPDQLVNSHIVESVFGLVVKDWQPDTRSGRIFPAKIDESL